ncbi:MAG: 3-deoxy-D-manno-octulosonic acid transferase [Rhodobacteraceae bacterium]|nr:3-deoxy-D-manno-octulosonic acid transferase [Paracoccaceae bacterium]
MICLHISTPEAQPAALVLVRAILRLRPGIGIVVTGANAGAALPAGAISTAAPAGTALAARAFLAAWSPDLVLFVGAVTPQMMLTAFLVEAAAQRVPLLLAEARFSAPGGARLPWFWSRAILRAQLAFFQRVLVPDQASVAWLGRLGAALDRVQTSGSIREPVEPLPCTEAERSALARQLRSRPVWFAVAVPEAEEATVLDAHERALMRAHRMLLIVLPKTPERAALIAAAAEARGLRAARRTLEEEPEDDVQVLVVEDESELGLWYRLAPVTWMGGTLMQGDSLRSPLEPAALGSAIVHGPAIAAHSADFARLSEARACRVAGSPAALADVVVELIAPDRVATLAHNAWVTISGDAGVAENIARQVLADMDFAVAQPKARV